MSQIYNKEAKSGLIVLKEAHKFYDEIRKRTEEDVPEDTFNMQNDMEYLK